MIFIKEQKPQKKIIVVFLCFLIMVLCNDCTKNIKNKNSRIEDSLTQKVEKDIDRDSEIEQKDKKKEIIKLYTNYLYDSELIVAVRFFNKKSEKYKIEITDCSSKPNKDGKMIEPEEVLQIEIEKQGEPDILYWSNSNLLKQYAREGRLADLSSFFEQGKEPLAESYNKKILKASKVDGKLYQIPYKFQLKVLLGNKKMMGNKTSWTMEEMLSLYKKLPKSFMYMTDISKENYIMDVFCYQQSEYRDHNTGRFHVETEDFMNILRFAKELPDWEADIGCSSKWTFEKMIPEGQLLLTRFKIKESDDIDDYKKYYKKAGGCNILSYPSVENDGILMEVFMYPFAILETSNYKEEAWKLLCSIESSLSSSQEFSVKKEVLKRKLKESGKNGKKVKMLLKRVGRIITDYDLKYFLEYNMHNWGKDSFADQDKEAEKVIQIIEKNAQKYFEGKETVEKATNKIQKKLEQFYEKNKWNLI